MIGKCLLFLLCFSVFIGLAGCKGFESISSRPSPSLGPSLIAQLDDHTENLSAYNHEVKIFTLPPLLGTSNVFYKIIKAPNKGFLTANSHDPGQFSYQVTGNFSGNDHLIIELKSGSQTVQVNYNFNVVDLYDHPIFVGGLPMQSNGLPVAPVVRADFSNNMTRNLQYNLSDKHSYIHPAHHTLDHRIQVENCNQVLDRKAKPPGMPSVDYHKCDINSLTGERSCRADGVCFYTSNPEALDQQIYNSNVKTVSQPIGFRAGIYDPANPNLGPQDYFKFHNSSLTNASYGRGHRAICDAFNDNPAGSVSPLKGLKNPYVCNGDHDCYQIHIIGRVEGYQGIVVPANFRTELWGVKIEVEVAEPKTANAHIVSVTPRGEPKKSPMVGRDNFFTPVVSGDGRLLIFSGETGIEYSINNSKIPCDVTGWTTKRPIIAMHSDPDATAYELAKFPIRDTQNRVMTPNNSENFRASYFWLDRSASNLFFHYAKASSNFYWDNNTNSVESKFQVSKLLGPGSLTAILGASSTEAQTEINKTRTPGSSDSIAFFGLWSSGKIVMPDTKLNRNTFGLGLSSTADLQLYENEITRVTHSDIRRKGSVENRFNFNSNLTPRSPNDVVWNFSTYVDMDEIVFDDYISQDTFISSPMNTVINRTGKYLDGFAEGQGYTQNVLIQNTASSFDCNSVNKTELNNFCNWDVPTSGILKNGGRVEPISYGGMKASGLFLNGNNYLHYKINPQSKSFTAKPWFYSFWFQPVSVINVKNGPSKTLLRLPNQSTVSIANERLVQIRYFNQNKVFQLINIDIPSGLALNPNKYTHLAIGILPPNGIELDRVVFWLDGMRLTAFNIAKNALRMSAGNLYFGGEPGKINPRGWVDEFKVLSHFPGWEEVCRHSYGTLVGLDSQVLSSAEDLIKYSKARLYPSSTHKLIGDFPQGVRQYPYYVCESTNPTLQYNAGLNSVEIYDKSFCIGKSHAPKKQADKDRCYGGHNVFPEGPIVGTLPRPNSLGNNFCLSCHNTNHPAQSLSEKALFKGLGQSAFDFRRQPLQQPSMINGVIPRHFLDGPYGLIPATTNTDYSLRMIDFFN